MLRKFLILMRVLSIAVLVVSMTGCQNAENVQPVAPSSGSSQQIPQCTDFPANLPTGIAIQDVRKSLEEKIDIPMDLLVPEVLEDLGKTIAPEEYYIDSLGLHWGHAKKLVEQTALGDCYHPYGLSIVGGSHFVYWFSYRPPSYNAYMAWIPIYAQPYGSNGVLVQKRDICWICGCNPICALIWTWICAK